MLIAQTSYKTLRHQAADKRILSIGKTLHALGVLNSVTHQKHEPNTQTAQRFIQKNHTVILQHGDVILTLKLAQYGATQLGRKTIASRHFSFITAR